jgi:2-C-methyl-D-erythritol 2,4-cyclodiphosphate synthase
MRVGIGYDIHRFDDARILVLGGVILEGERGLSGHSDADVLLHAIIDALLGAAGLGDIGSHFPEDDDQWRDARSSDLLAHVLQLLHGQSFEPYNVDVTVIAEVPHLAPHMTAIKRSVADLLALPETRVNFKATTNERFGDIGRGEGMAALAVALLEDAPS